MHKALAPLKNVIINIKNITHNQGYTNGKKLTYLPLHLQ